jgi:hypothetical protein
MKQHFRAQRHRRNEPLSQSLIRTMVGELKTTHDPRFSTGQGNRPLQEVV